MPCLLVWDTEEEEEEEEQEEEGGTTKGDTSIMRVHGDGWTSE